MPIFEFIFFSAGFSQVSNLNPKIFPSLDASVDGRSSLLVNLNQLTDNLKKEEKLHATSEK
jgi:hypothetical protein